MKIQEYSQLDKIIANGHYAFNYAWDHYEDLNSRKSVYTLYGPHTLNIGAASPSHLSGTKGARRLAPSTRRTAYTVYELDENYQPLRVRHINRFGIDCTYHLFLVDGIVCARPFFRDEKAFYKNEICLLSFSKGKPSSFAIVSSNSLSLETYDYIDAGKIMVTSYLYFPNSLITTSGVPMSWDSPFGAPESPVKMGTMEREFEYIEFSSWFPG